MYPRYSKKISNIFSQITVSYLIEIFLDEHFKVCNQCFHPDAECVYDFNSHNFQCQCKAGYEGDGKLCAKILGI